MIPAPSLRDDLPSDLRFNEAAIAAMLGHGRHVLLEPPLDPARPLPYAYNVFDIRVRRRA